MLFNNKLPQTSFWKRQWKMDPNLLKNINYGQTVWWYRSQKVVLWFSFYLHLTMKIKRVGCFNELITLNPISFFSELTVHFTRFPIQSLKVERTELTTILVIYSCLPSYLWIWRLKYETFIASLFLWVTFIWIQLSSVLLTQAAVRVTSEGLTRGGSTSKITCVFSVVFRSSLIENWSASVIWWPWVGSFPQLFTTWAFPLGTYNMASAFPQISSGRHKEMRVNLTPLKER